MKKLKPFVQSYLYEAVASTSIENRKKKLNIVTCLASTFSPSLEKAGLDALEPFFSQIISILIAMCLTHTSSERPQPALIAWLSPGLIAASQARNHMFMFVLQRARQGLANGLLCSQSVLLSGFLCEVAVDMSFAEKSVIYLELSRYCVVLHRESY